MMSSEHARDGSLALVVMVQQCAGYAVGQQPHFIRWKVLISAHVCAQPADGASTRIVRKQAELIEKLQRQFATLESRFVDYQEAQAAMAQVCLDSKTALDD